MLYHDALSTTAIRLGLALRLHDRGTEVARAAERLGVSVDEVEEFLRAAGKSLGPPWRKEHRLAAAAAMAALGERTRISLDA
jgi:predicted transcriptional regulator